MTVWKTEHDGEFRYNIRDDEGNKTTHDNWESYDLWELLIALGAKPIRVGNLEFIQY